MGQALTGAAAPYLAEQIHELTKNDPAAKAVAHAVLGAVTSYAAGNSALAGAAGAVTGELMATAIKDQLYPGRDVSDLSETEKQTISILGTLAAGLAGGVAGNSTTDAVAGGQAGKNAVENNSLMLEGFGTGFWSNVQSQGSLVNNTNLTDENGKVLNPATPEEIKYASDKLVTGVVPEGQDITKTIVEGYTDGVLIFGAAYLGPAASIAKVVAGATIAEIANGTYQWFGINSEKNQSLPESERKTWDYWGSASSAITGALAPGRSVLQNASIAAGGAMFTDGPDMGAIGSAAAGAWLGGKFGEYAPGVVNSIIGKELPGFIYDVSGAFASEAATDASKDALKKRDSEK